MSDFVSFIKKCLSSGDLVVGRDVVFKSFRRGVVSSVFLASNCPASFVDDVKHYADVYGCEVNFLDVPNLELGVVCRKPFGVSMVAVVKSK